MQLIGVRAVVCAALLGACTPDGGVRFDTPVSASAAFAGETGQTSGEGGESTGGAGSSAPPPPAGGEDVTGGAGETGETGGGAVTGTLVPARAGWRYLVSAPVGDWTGLDFADETWPEGQAPLGDGDVVTAIDAAAAPVGVWLRRRFMATPGPALLMLYLRRGDGAAVYLNGVELVRSNLVAGELGPGTLAEDDLGGDEVRRYMRFVVPGAALQAGENVLAVALRRAAQGQPGLAFDLQLDTFDPASAPVDELSVQWRTRSYGGEYSDENVGAAWVERDDGTFVRTLMVWAAVRREHLVRWQAGADGDVVDAVTGATRGSHRSSEVTWDLRDAQGATAGPGAYRLWLEFTEDDSGKGAPAGPRLELPFTLGDGPAIPAAPVHPQFRDVLLLVP